MAKSVLVIECDDHGHFFLSLAAGTLTFGDVPGHAEMILRSLSVSHVRCEIEIDDEVVVVSRPPSPTGQGNRTLIVLSLDEDLLKESVVPASS
jgi:hypothetical protein